MRPYGVHQVPCPCCYSVRDPASRKAAKARERHEARAEVAAEVERLAADAYYQADMDCDGCDFCDPPEPWVPVPPPPPLPLLVALAALRRDSLLRLVEVLPSRA